MTSDSYRAPLPGDIGLARVSGSTGRLIRLGQELNGDGFADYEHAFVVSDDTGPHGLPMIVEAEPGGARYTELHYARVRWCAGISHALTDAQREGIVQAACGLIGVRYSFLDYAALAARRLRIPVPGLKGYVSSTHHLICSQLADEAYREAGVHVFTDDRWPGYVTPGMLYRRDLLLRAAYVISP